jgi:gliding motility-associated lipoprotein GldH
MQNKNFIIKNKYFIVFFCGIAAISCGPKIVYEQSRDIKQPWSYGQSLTYDFEITDTTKAYDLSLKVDHRSDFTYENMYVKVTTIFPDGKKVDHPLSLQLASPNGTWIGDCRGDFCSAKIFLASSAYYKHKGRYKINFEQFSRNDTIGGIKQMTLIVSESTQ